MITLEFSKPWQAQTSPINLDFATDFNGITLEFDQPWQNRQSPIEIRFNGESSPPGPVDNSVGIELGLGYLTSDEVAQLVALSYESNAVGSRSELAWQSGISVSRELAMDYQTGELVQVMLMPAWEGFSVSVQFELAWATQDLLASEYALEWFTNDAIQRNHELSWLNAGYVGSELAIACDSEQDGISVEIGYQNQPGIGNEVMLRWGLREPRWVCSTKYRPPTPGIVTMTFTNPYAAKVSPITLEFTRSPEYCYFDSGGGVVENTQTLPNLDFKIPIEPQIRRAYIMQPTLICTRVSDALAIVIDSISIGDRRGQYAHSVDIEFSSAIDASRAENELLLIDINGYQFYALPEQPSRREAFGQASYTSAGRSRSAQLSSPWRLPVSYTNSVARSFGGILGDILQNSGWQPELVGFTDFNVPAGAFSVSAASPIDAVNEAASQIGCMIVADEENSKLQVLPYWPTLPWSFDSAIADINIHDAVILSFDSHNEINPLCNAAWVRGEQQGVSRQVKRAGTAGDVATDDINAQLIVSDLPARLAGTKAIADTGNKQLITVKLPVMNDLPPLKKGMLIGVVYRGDVFKATCDSCNISAVMDLTTGLDVVQTAVLVRHLN